MYGTAHCRFHVRRLASLAALTRARSGATTSDPMRAGVAGESTRFHKRVERSAPDKSDSDGAASVATRWARSWWLRSAGTSRLGLAAETSA
jgi:hypothetical protein